MPDRKIPPKPEHVVQYLIMRGTGSSCANCRYRIEIAGPEPGKDCLDCGWLRNRNDPYYGLVPVWEEGHIPTPKENKMAFAHAEALKAGRRLPEGLPDYCVPDPLGR